MEWFKKKMRVFLFVCLLFPFYSYAAKISLSISGKIEDHSAMLYFPDGRELPISIDASGKGELVVDVTEPVYVALGYHYISRTLLLTPDTDIQISFENKKFGERVAITGTGSQVNIYLNNGRLKAAKIDDMALGEKAFFLKMDSILNVNLQELDHAGLSEEINEMEKIRLK
ncbi:TlpA family protein disulfide reductase, partial [Phocaeicola vulgatus]